MQTLTVSADNPLVLFNLDISLEWDARYDEQYLSQLAFDLQRTSDFLYDWSNGQVALGEISIYHNREHWNETHIRVYATNHLRPMATKGGVVTSVITDPITSTISYAPGMVHIGATWNRFGDPGVSSGDDWARALAHEPYSLRAARNASWGISTEPTRFIRRFPAFCFSRSLRLRLMSPP